MENQFDPDSDSDTDAEEKLCSDQSSRDFYPYQRTPDFAKPGTLSGAAL
jgi:hypothetical protein